MSAVLNEIRKMRTLQDYEIISLKEDHKKPMQGYAYIIEVLVFWRYNPIS